MKRVISVIVLGGLLSGMDKEYSYEELLAHVQNKQLNFNEQDGNKRSLLHQALIAGKSPRYIDDLIRAWWSCEGFGFFRYGINRQDKFGRTALHYAILYAPDEIVYKILEQDVRDISDQDERERFVQNYFFVNVDIQDVDGKTPVHWAMLTTRNTAVLKALINKSRYLSLCDSVGHTALHKAVIHGFIDGIKVLVAKGQSYNMLDDQGKPLLMYALESSNGTIVTELIKLGADPNIQDTDGNTPLHKVAMKRGPGNHNQLVQIMLNMRASKNIKNALGQTAYDLADSTGKTFFDKF